MKSIGLTKRRRMKIGLLGGSFNPAHFGHIHISEIALKALNLNEVWWLITPQNPLKIYIKNAPLNNRVSYAKKLVKNRKIKIDSLESKYSSNFTVDTLKKLIKEYKGTNFIWLMGADNLTEIHTWYKWKNIFKIMPVAVFDRGKYSYSVFNSIAGKRYFKSLHKTKNSKSIFFKTNPNWIFLRIKKKHISSSQIRATKEILTF